MRRAADVTEAAFEFFRPRSVWDDGDWPSFDELYVERPDESPRARMAAELTHAGPRAKVWLTGPRGSGKSTELRALADELRDRLVPVRISLRERLDPGRGLSLRMLLMMLSFWLLRHVSREKLPMNDTWKLGPKIDSNFSDWVGVIRNATGLPAPRSSADVIDTLGRGLFQLLRQARYDDDLRTKLEVADHYSIDRLNQLVSDLIELIERHGEHPALLIIDDAEHFDQGGSAERLFIEHAETLEQLPCRAALVYPPQLDLRPEAHALWGGRLRARISPLPAGHGGGEFLRRVGRGRLARDELISDEALELATRYCSGLPGELIHLLGLGFAGAHLAGKQQLDTASMGAALEHRARVLATMLADEAVHRSVAAAREHGRLPAGAGALWDSSLLVELAPHGDHVPRFGPHPLLSYSAEQGG